MTRERAPNAWQSSSDSPGWRVVPPAWQHPKGGWWGDDMVNVKAPSLFSPGHPDLMGLSGSLGERLAIPTLHCGSKMSHMVTKVMWAGFLFQPLLELFYYFFIAPYCMYMGQGGTHTWHRAHVESEGHLVGANFLLSGESQGLNSGGQASSKHPYLLSCLTSPQVCFKCGCSVIQGCL